jgi:hypothetical protein
MERFLKRHEGRVLGTIAGFDRVLFRGNLSSICHLGGMERFLSSQRVLYKDFKPFVEKISDQVKEHAKKLAAAAQRPFIYLASSQESKEEKARQIMEQDQIREGLICVLSCVEPCRSYAIRRSERSKRLYLIKAERKCLHLYFYFADQEFGLMHVRLQTWLPLTIQVCLNGREYLAQQMEQTGVGYEQQGNCFTWVADFKRAQELIDRLITRNWASFLQALARKVNPWLDPRGELVLRPYYWTIREAEYATDILFTDPEALAAVYPALIDHAMKQFHSEDVLRFLGRRNRSQSKGEVRTSLQRRVEGLRIRHWVAENSIKMYDKAGSVLRIETTINNPRRFQVHRRRINKAGVVIMKWLPLRKGIADISRRVAVSRAANERYLEALAVVGEPTPSHRLLDKVSKGVEHRGRKFRALRPISPEDSRVFSTILRGEFLIQGIRNQDLRQRLYPQAHDDPDQRRKNSARVTRYLELLKSHALIYRVPKTNYYRITKYGHELMCTATKFRETDVALLAA